MAENDGSSIAGGIIAVIVIVAVVGTCDHPTRVSSDGYPSASTDSAVSELVDAVDEYESARQKLAEEAFDETRRAEYLAAVDADIDRENYDFDGLIITGGEKKSRTRFRDMLVEACRSRGIAPPGYLSLLGPPFDESKRPSTGAVLPIPCSFRIASGDGLRSRERPSTLGVKTSHG